MQHILPIPAFTTAVVHTKLFYFETTLQYVVHDLPVELKNAVACTQ